MKKIIAFLILCALVTSVQCQIDRADTLLPDLLNYNPEVDLPSKYPAMTTLERAHFEMGDKAIQDALTSIMLKEAPDKDFWDTHFSGIKRFYTFDPVKYLGEEAQVSSVPILVVRNDDGEFFLCIYFNDEESNYLWEEVQSGIMYTLYLDGINPLKMEAHERLRFNDAIVGFLYADDNAPCSRKLKSLDRLFLYYELE